ncbi:hypothetical protein IOD16_32700 [Saccharothrix sp. 6-C]|uniref:hypothetical protein n=1 Tax=Saccharothrix sp. 6-C TaxID=2781735 RepID=UPI0019176A74|nr:hypothetical protein [Saccharothrix sp. 6-C]QQQ75782.1 hypothetical protein IOD16_32700 [Saccharothrix sp. 6-C]
MRILGIELRRTAAPVLGVLAVLVMVGLLHWGPSMKNSTAWTRQWTTSAEFIRLTFLFVWPLALGAGGLQGLRDRRSGVEELFGSTPRPRAQRVAWTFGAVAVALTAGYAVVSAVGAVQVASATDYFHLGWLPVALVGVLALVGGAWLGMGVGRLAPSPLTPPALAVAGFALMVLGLEPAAGAFRWTLLLPSLPSPVTVFASVAWSVTAVQAVWFAGVAAAGFLLVALRRAWPGVLPLLMAGAVAVPLLPSAPEGVWTPDAAAAELVCHEGLCLTRAHEDERPALTGPAREALRALAKLPSPPTSVREVAAPVRPVDGRGPEPAEAVWVHLDEFTYFRRVPPTAEQVTAYLVAGAGTRSCYGQYVPAAGARELAARTVMTAWLTGRFEPLPMYRSWVSRETDGLAAEAWEHLRSLPGPDQAARVQAARDTQAACAGDALTTLMAGTT